MGAYKNSFTLLCDEEGEVDVSKLTEKAAEMEILKKKIEEDYKKNSPLLPSWHSIVPHEFKCNAAAEEGAEEDWKEDKSSRRRRNGGEKLGGEGGSSGAVVVERMEVKKVEEEEEEEGGRESEDEYEHVGLAIEQITKGKHNRRRINTWRKKEAAAIRKLKGFDRH